MAEIILKRSQFIDGGDGRLYRTATAKPRTSGGLAAKLQTGTLEYATSNDAVATAEEDPNDETKVKIFWVGAGTAQINVKGDADLDEGETREVTGVLDLKLEEDEADAIDLVLDEIPG